MSVGFAINVAAVRTSALSRCGGQDTAGNRIRAKGGATLQAQGVGLLKDRLVIRDIEVLGDVDGLGNGIARNIRVQSKDSNLAPNISNYTYCKPS